jgi:hypothetical protein
MLRLLATAPRQELVSGMEMAFPAVLPSSGALLTKAFPTVPAVHTATGFMEV